LVGGAIRAAIIAGPTAPAPQPVPQCHLIEAA
jgi:hypothetical protein